MVPPSILLLYVMVWYGTPFLTISYQAITYHSILSFFLKCASNRHIFRHFVGHLGIPLHNCYFDILKKDLYMIYNIGYTFGYWKTSFICPNLNYTLFVLLSANGYFVRHFIMSTYMPYCSISKERYLHMYNIG